MMLKTSSLLLIFLSAVATTWAQPGANRLSRHMFPAELVMRHQQELGLSDDQRKSIKMEMQQGQKHFLDLQWELQKELEIIEGMLSQEKVNEEGVVTQLDKVLDIERMIKRTHMVLLIRIMNLLMPAQKAKLAQIRQKARRARHPLAGQRPMDLPSTPPSF